MKFAFLILFSFMSFLSFCQIVEKNNLKQIDMYAKYKGLCYSLNKRNLVRFKLYGREYVQFTYIRKIKRSELRFYTYFRIFDFRMTPALSLRLFI